MKKRLAGFYVLVCMIIFCISIYANVDYFYQLAYDNLILYQIKQVASILILYAIGYLFLKMIQNYFDDLWVALLAMPCGIAVWVFTAQLMMFFFITYEMYRVFIAIGILLTAGWGIKARIIKEKRVWKTLLPSAVIVWVVVGTALLVSTGWNYINMNYDSYLYFADYGRTIAAYGDYREWNTTANAFVITNIGQFLAILNSYTAFWGLEYCLPEQSFLVLNMGAIFYMAVYEHAQDIKKKEKRIGYAVFFTAALMVCTCVLVFANWMLSNAFIMYYLMIAGILGARAPKKITIDYASVISGCGLAITLLRKDGIIVVCFLFVCYCCSKIMKPGKLALLLLPSALAQSYYILFVRLFLRPETHTARGTSLLSNKFVLLLFIAVALTFIYLLLIHPFVEQWLKEKLMLIILIMMVIVAFLAAISTFWKSVDHIDAVLKILVSPAYGFSLLLWLLPLAVIAVKPIKIDYGIFLVVGYCILTFLIYWNKGNTEQGIDNSGMRSFVQIVPMIFFVESYHLKSRIFHSIDSERQI